MGLQPEATNKLNSANVGKWTRSTGRRNPSEKYKVVFTAMDVVVAEDIERG
jgi:hypothetical protein